ncbi:uncharacterized protein EKO05_0003352 [Ascochyta rabiei]|uniref:Uncharacterized protein n=1 Tax=Didymella rabiei TaxID=5454 RepID=A0A162YG31_DIDRA|nr:uncharacterized protein EKO05_0003352 [Ascochyta rabiei]KZM20022.1 hypothetical protein ST47_g8865 [Ascochyta rabiei]UPX12816.1 hypothetical protein EKO05_0003352 [Ascochyta rabiei]
MATHHSLPGTPSRRVLGDLTPRAMNTPSKPRSVDSSELSRAQSPLKQVHATAHAPQVLADKENTPSADAFPHGRKRSIAEVDDAEKVPTAKMVALPQPDAIAQLTAAAVQRHTVHAPTRTRLPSTKSSTLQSNNPVGLADPGSPTERATPTPSPPSPPLEPIQDSQKSFSEFLDYGLCASQQSEHGIAVPKPTPKPAPPQTPSSAPAPKSRAQLLRTRLNFAKYKVRTNQVAKRTSDVLSEYELSSSPDALRTSAEHLAATPSARVPNITVSSPARHPVFVRANLDPFRPIGALGHPPVSFAPPTHSAGVESRTVEGYDVRSSPPVQSVSPAALESPLHGQASKHERLQRLKEQQWRETSAGAGTAGSAAKGLLELMSGRR